MKKKVLILGIESSCDETAASIIEENNGRVKILSNIVSSQMDIHKDFGGVVPGKREAPGNDPSSCRGGPGQGCPAEGNAAIRLAVS